MDHPAYRIAYLIAGFIRNTLTEKEHQELDDWVNESDHNMQLFEDLTDERNLEANLEWMDKVQSEQSYQSLKERGAFDVSRKKIRFNPVWIAAASVILIAGIFFIYRYAGKNKSGNNEMAIADTLQLHPGSNRATLTLADGRVIDLTNAKTGIIVSGQGSHVNKPADGELVYETDDSRPGASLIHTLSTPVGGQYQVRLPDGTKVWLNAATTLKYPAQFEAGERKVEVNGEAYFEVAKNEQKPFKVILADSAAVTVLGTHFNIMAYSDEKTKEVTLLEGSVAISKKENTKKLEPGSQASISENEITKQSGIDTDEIIGWKNGLFVFHDAPIESIMNQIARWYDAKIVYQAEIRQQFNATILRSEPLAKLLHLLELNGYVRFKIENKTIYVLP